MKKILFVLSGNLSTTPRAYKIFKSLKNQYDIDILAVNRSSKWLELDFELLAESGHKIKHISLIRKDIKWLIASILNKLALILYPFFKSNGFICFLASDKAGIFIYQHLKKKSLNSFDLICSFSYSAIYPTIFFAHKHNIPLIIDIEDFHPLEKASLQEQNRRSMVLKKQLPFAEAITCASPLILSHTQTFTKLDNTKFHLINNSFSQNDFEFKNTESDKIQVVWFSQNIDFGRGLEIYIPIFEQFKDKIEIDLIGNLSNSFIHSFLSKYTDFVRIISPLKQEALHKKICNYDLGLAIEQTLEDKNRDIALTNKIFTYAQAGLYILASHTKAQNKFMAQNPDFGIISRTEINDIANKINIIINNLNQIREKKKMRFNQAKKLSWENEVVKIENIWKSII